MSLLSTFAQDVDITGQLTVNNNITIGSTISYNPTNITTTGTLTLNGTEIVASFVTFSANSVATKSYVETIGNQLDFKESCRVKTDAALLYTAAVSYTHLTLPTTPYV